MSDEKTELTEEDKEYIKANFAEMPLIDLTRKISGNPEADGRHYMGKIISRYIGELGGKPKTTKHIKVEMELTEEHKTYIKNNYKNSKPLEIAKNLFPEKKQLTALNKETILVQEYIKSFDPDAIESRDELSVGTYRAPQKIETLLFKVLKYVTKFSIGDFRAPDIKNLTELEKKQFNALLSYINTHRFLSQINRYYSIVTKTYLLMKRSTALLLLFLSIIGLTILLSSCGDNVPQTKYKGHTTTNSSCKLIIYNESGYIAGDTIMIDMGSMNCRFVIDTILSK